MNFSLNLPGEYSLYYTLYSIQDTSGVTPQLEHFSCKSQLVIDCLLVVGISNCEGLNFKFGEFALKSVGANAKILNS